MDALHVSSNLLSAHLNEQNPRPSVNTLASASTNVLLAICNVPPLRPLVSSMVESVDTNALTPSHTSSLAVAASAKEVLIAPRSVSLSWSPVRTIGEHFAHVFLLQRERPASDALPAAVSFSRARTNTPSTPTARAAPSKCCIEQTTVLSEVSSTFGRIRRSACPGFFILSFVLLGSLSFIFCPHKAYAGCFG